MKARPDHERHSDNPNGSGSLAASFYPALRAAAAALEEQGLHTKTEYHPGCVTLSILGAGPEDRWVVYEARSEGDSYYVIRLPGVEFLLQLDARELPSLAPATLTARILRDMEESSLAIGAHTEWM